MGDDTSNPGHTPPGLPTQSGPAAAQDTAFDAAQFVDLADPADKPMPSAFLGMRGRLSVEQIGKLRELDPSVAMVRFRPRGGRDTRPEYLAAFIADFEAEAAEFVGKGGPMLAIIDPNDGKLRPFVIGIDAPPPAAGAKPASEIQMLVDRLDAMQQQQQQMMQLVLLGGNGGGNLQDQLAVFAQFAQIFKAMNPAQDPAAYVQAMGAAFNGISTVMLGGMRQFQQASAEMVIKPEKDWVDDVERLAKIPGASEIAGRLAGKILPDPAPNISQPAQQTAFDRAEVNSAG